MSSFYYKLIASVILTVPIVILLIFAIGEMIGGDIFGAQHFVQLAPIVILLALAWKFPRATGAILIAASVILGILYVFFAREQMPFFTILFVEGLLFLPPLIAGVLFYVAGRQLRPASNPPAPPSPNAA